MMMMTPREFLYKNGRCLSDNDGDDESEVSSLLTTPLPSKLTNVNIE